MRVPRRHHTLSVTGEDAGCCQRVFPGDNWGSTQEGQRLRLSRVTCGGASWYQKRPALSRQEVEGKLRESAGAGREERGVEVAERRWPTVRSAGRLPAWEPDGLLGLGRHHFRRVTGTKGRRWRELGQCRGGGGFQRLASAASPVRDLRQQTCHGF